MDLRDKGVVLFPVVEGEGFVVMVVLSRALLISLDLLIVPTCKLTSYLGFFVKVDFEVGSAKR